MTDPCKTITTSICIPLEEYERLQRIEAQNRKAVKSTFRHLPAGVFTGTIRGRDSAEQ